MDADVYIPSVLIHYVLSVSSFYTRWRETQLLISLSFVGYNIEHHQQFLGHEEWKEMLNGCNSSEDVPQVRHVDEFNGNVRKNLHYENSCFICVLLITFVYFLYVIITLPYFHANFLI